MLELLQVAAGVGAGGAALSILVELVGVSNTVSWPV
jgi:hypothetical protein